MRVVRCHQFAAFEADDDDDEDPSSSSSTTTTSNDSIKKKQQQQHNNNKPARLLKEPLPLRHVLKLHYENENHEQLLKLKLKPNDVMIETYYVGIMYPDSLQAQGLYQIRPKLPYVPGMDLSGIVMSVGSSNVTNVKVGDKVIGVCMKNTITHGALSDIVVLNKNHVYKLPTTTTTTSTTTNSTTTNSTTTTTTTLPLKTVANIGRNYFAAYHSLKNIGQLCCNDEGNKNKNNKNNKSEIILITGSSGGVGMATIELAKAMTNGQCKIIAGVSTKSKIELPKRVGADIVLTYGKTKTSYQQFKLNVKKVCNEWGGSNPNGCVDLVIDMVQGLLFETLISLTKPYVGKIVLVGFAGGQKPIRPGLLLVKEISVIGSLWGRYAIENPHEWDKSVNEILHYLSSGQIKPRVDRVYKLKDYTKAFELYQLNQGKGNTVICMKSEDDNENDNDDDDAENNENAENSNNNNVNGGGAGSSKIINNNDDNNLLRRRSKL